MLHVTNQSKCFTTVQHTQFFSTQIVILSLNSLKTLWGRGFESHLCHHVWLQGQVTRHELWWQDTLFTRSSDHELFLNIGLSIISKLCYYQIVCSFLGQPRPLFCLFSVFSKKQDNFHNKSMWKNVLSIQYMAPGFKPTTFET